jgi:hypothetical protein
MMRMGIRVSLALSLLARYELRSFLARSESLMCVSTPANRVLRLAAARL